MKLNKEKIYDLSELTSEEWELLTDTMRKESNLKFKYDTLEGNVADGYKTFYFSSESNWCLKHNDDVNEPTHNAKELFYTLENIQVDCRELSEDKIKEMCKIFTLNGFNKIDSEVTSIHSVLRKRWNDKDCNFGILGDHKDGKFYTITYEKFMELFTEPEKVISDKFEKCEELFIKGFEEMAKSLRPHYDNTKGSIYKFCNDQKLNSWEFDIIKRVVRCRKKGQFKEDLQKTKDLIDLYLKEFTDEK